MKRTIKWFENQDEQEMPSVSRIHWALYLAVGKFSSIIGLSQWQFDKEKRTIKFELFSLATAFSLLRLVTFSFPFILLPVILFVLFKDEELESFADRNNLTISELEYHPKQNILGVIHALDYFSKYLYYVLPLGLTFNVARPHEKLFQMAWSPYDQRVQKRVSGIGKIVIPIFGFLLFLSGKVLQTTASTIAMESSIPGITKLPFQMYYIVGSLLLAPLGIQLYLAIQEFLFYHYCSVYHAFASLQLQFTDGEGRDAEVHESTLQLIDFMENFCQAFGPLLLMDLTLMLLYWLIHLYLAFATLSKEGEGVLSASGSILIIGSELWRVITLTSACTKFTEVSAEVNLRQN